MEAPRSPAGPPLPGPLVRFKRWLAAHHMTLMTMADTPHSIALGSAIGIFFGFTPLWSLKTLFSIGGGVDIQVQQDRSRDRRYFARHRLAFDASDLLLAIQDRHAGSSRPTAATRSLSPFIFSRSYDLAGDLCA